MSDSAEKLHAVRHSLAHLLATAVLEHDPGVKLAIGPTIDNGFYYDFQFSEGKLPSPEDLKKLERRMKHLIKQNLAMTGKEISAEDARKQFANQPFKLELVSEFASEGKTLTTYTLGTFTDLCKGGHIESTKEINGDAFTLSRIAGAYWRGDEKNPMLTRIYGIAFSTKEELDAYLAQIEEAKKRDHRKLGKELELFTIIDEIGAGLPLFYPKGAILRRTIENFITELQESRGYVPIWIPHITKGKLYEISGHLDKYDAMYTPMRIDEEDYYLKPMNCPHFMMLYKTLPHSYRDLPLRYTSTTTNYRYEKSGELSGLTRVRSLTQDDCHVFCLPGQIEEEITLMTHMIGEVYKAFGFTDFWVRISLRDSKNKEKYLGSDDIWNTAEDALRTVVKKTGWKYKEAEDEAAFYGPKLDFMLKDALGREWQLSTIQLDFNLPERFELEYTDNEGKKSQPVVIHRAMLGSTERFMGIMIEHFAGAFPLWLSPVQIVLVPVSDKHTSYAKEVFSTLKKEGVRAELDVRNESLGRRVRDAKTGKVPYVIVIGDKEMESRSVTLEGRTEKGVVLSLESLVQKITTDIRERTLD